MTFLRRFCGGLALAGALLAANVAGAAPVEDAIRAWVAGIDSSPNWHATFKSLTYNPTSQDAVLQGLEIKPRQGGLFTLALGAVTVRGYVGAVAGGFSAATILVDQAQFVAGPATISVANVRLDGISIPNFAGVSVDSDHYMTSLVKVYGIFTKAKLDRAVIDEMKLNQDISGIKSEFSYRNMVLTRLADGKMDQFTAGPVNSSSPSPDGILSFSIDRLEAHSMDFGAFVHVFDPDQYVGGVGDGVWKTALGTASYRDMTVEGPGMKFSLGDVTYENMRVRQPPKSFAPLFDQMFAHPDMSAVQNQALLRDNLSNLLSSIAIGRIGFDDLDVAGNGNTTVRIGELALEDLSATGLGEFRVGGVRVASPDFGDVTLERFAFGGITFPSADTILAATDPNSKAKSSDVIAQLVPHLGFVEMLGLALSTDKLEMAMDRLKVDLGGYVGAVPTAVAFDLRGLNIPVDKLKLDDEARKVFTDMGYTNIAIDYGFNVAWHEADETLSVNDFHIAAHDIGRVSADIELGGLPRIAIEKPSILKDSLDHLLFRGIKITVEDSTLIDRSLAVFGQKLGLKQNNNANFRQQFANALPFFLLFLKNGAFQAKIAPALKSFVLGPGALVITAKPLTPIPFATVTQTLDQSPQRLPDLLSIELTTVQ